MKVRNTKASQSPSGLTDKSSADDELRKISRDWSPEQWEQYLQTTESHLKEDLIPVEHYDRIAEESETSIFDYAQDTASPALVERVRLAVKDLTIRQRQVVELIFFKLRSEREAALELGITYGAVTKRKRKAIKNLRRIFIEGVCTLPLVEGRKKKSEESND